MILANNRVYHFRSGIRQLSLSVAEACSEECSPCTRKWRCLRVSYGVLIPGPMGRSDRQCPSYREPDRGREMAPTQEGANLVDPGSAEQGSPRPAFARPRTGA